jgi:hypothetical protein
MLQVELSNQLLAALNLLEPGSAPQSASDAVGGT